MNAGPVLAIEELSIDLPRHGRMSPVIRRCSLEVGRGKVLGLVGESGCGKSITSLACLGLAPAGAEVAGSIRLDGVEVVGASPRSLRRLRGGRCAMIFQNPGKALNPFFTIGRQMTDVIRLHRRAGRRKARDIALDSLADMRLPDPELVLGKYPHQLSGGQLQRVTIAMAMACDPALLIADEPTTALDVTIQAQVIRLLRDLVRERDLAILFITHDLGVVASLCDRVAVMYAGEVVEEADCASLFAAPSHPYTRKLLASVPQLGRGRKDLVQIAGQVPDLAARPSGCSFHPRCDHATDQCRAQAPALRNLGEGRHGACHHAESIARLAAEDGPAPEPRRSTG